MRSVARDQDDIETEVGEDAENGVHADTAITSLEARECSQSQPESLGGLDLSAYAARAFRPDDVSEVRECHDADAADVGVGGGCGEVSEIWLRPAWHSLYLDDLLPQVNIICFMALMDNMIYDL